MHFLVLELEPAWSQLATSPILGIAGAPFPPLLVVVYSFTQVSSARLTGSLTRRQLVAPLVRFPRFESKTRALWIRNFNGYASIHLFINHFFSV